MTSQMEKIDAFFLEIEKSDKLQNEFQNLTDIEQKFKEGKAIIDEIEEDDTEKHGYYRFNYHIKYASCLKTIGEMELSNKQNSLAKKFEQYAKNLQNEDIHEEKSITIFNKVANPGEKYVDEVEKRLKEIKGILKKNDIIETFREIFNCLYETPKTFESYKTIIICETSLNQKVGNITIAELNNKALNADVKEELNNSLTSLNALASDIAYDKRISFILYVLNSSNKTEIIFSGIPFTSGEINRHFKELALYFHPDKTGDFNAPTSLRDEHKNLGEELFKHIVKSKKRLLADLENIIHEEKAYEFWKIAIDYRNAAEGKWDKLRVLNQREINKHSSEELKGFSIANGKLAFEEYREACKLVDESDIKKQIKLRENMALCLHITDQSLESQLYALSAIRMILTKCPTPTSQDYIGIKKILDKVKGNSNNSHTGEKSDSIPLELEKLGPKNSIYEKICYQHSIDKDIEQIISELMLKPDRDLVRCKSSIFIESTLYYAIGTIVPIIPDVIEFFNMSSRNRLTEIINNALDAYDKGEYQEFINILSEEYKKGDSILKLKNPEDVIVPTNIIKTCRDNHIRSDCIAYLLNSIGETLVSRKIQIDGKNANDLKAFAKNVFHGVLNENLVNDAKKLDDRIHELRKENNKSYISRGFYSPISWKKYDYLFIQDASDARKMPFVSRLEEIRNIARINIATLDMLTPGSETIDQAIKIINEIRKSIDGNYQFVGTSKLRLDILQDFVWVIEGKETSEEMFDEDFPEDSPDLSPSKSENKKYFDYLDELEKAKSKPERIQIYNNIATYFEQLAEKDYKIDRLNSLRNWNSAQNNYENAREIDPKNLVSALGYTESLIKLSKYTQVIELLEASPFLNLSSEYWRLRSIAYCKQTNYEKSSECIIESLRLDPKNKLADDQRSFLKKLRNENSSECRVNKYKKEKIHLKYEEDYFSNSRSNENPVYNILSIDGGGIRGILPALWLSEIEYRTRRPISHLFNMITGTSTGGIVAAGLSKPHNEYPDFKPMFSATDLLNIYQNHSKRLFTLDNSWSPKSKYTDEGRSNLFKEYFGQTKLSNALTDLVIPAINEDNAAPVCLFTRNDARNDESKNDTFVDALMAATSIPTFFSPYNIRHKGLFSDGGMHVNNPAMTSFNEAIRYRVASEKVFILSLGTGNYIPNPSKPVLYRDQLFWASNQFNIANDENEIDRQMYSMLENRYQRWQVSFEYSIKLDDITIIPLLVEIGHQYLEELYESDENPINKLIEYFENKNLEE
ncbi:13816_t:CDS:1 [Dentiscutata erythropus]|uniref:13816_t:CDS:1 n=1 Tax=Dentiscutata erythropus TaxID=1348616 RepID=A0A9N9F895_9GLOM|nr:13816_t:CDS:1 [Dentiscutata erythropus]